MTATTATVYCRSLEISGAIASHDHTTTSSQLCPQSHNVRFSFFLCLSFSNLSVITLSDNSRGIMLYCCLICHSDSQSLIPSQPTDAQSKVYKRLGPRFGTKNCLRHFAPYPAILEGGQKSIIWPRFFDIIGNLKHTMVTHMISQYLQTFR